MSVDLPLLHAGKVRRLYDWDADHLLIVATDAISAYDYVLSSPVPGKGVVLTQLSLWWFGQLADVIENHLTSVDVPPQFAGRGMMCEKLDMVPVECVARGYLTGSGLAEYRETGRVCGVLLPDGLMDGSRLPEPIFTPAIKAPMGEHDENVDFATIARLHGAELAARLRDATLAIYGRAERLARERGVIIADTKFEFGLRRGAERTLVLADEVLTPDSSRFWDAATWSPGGPQPSIDKQYVRDWLVHESGWDKASGEAPPPLPPEVIAATKSRYEQAFERLTGHAIAYPLGN